MQSPKRIKLTHDTNADTPNVKHIQDLPPEIFQHCLDFVGKGNFAFVAPVSKQFYWGYINLGIDNPTVDVTTALEQGRNKRTTAEAVSNGSLRLATECFLKAPKEFKEEVCRRAAVKGRVDVLDCAVSLGVHMKLIFEDPDKSMSILLEVIENCHLDVIEFLSKEKVDFNDAEFFCDVRDKGHARDLHWMMTKGIIEREREDMAADLAMNGELDMLKENYSDCITRTTFEKCALGGHVEVMNWLLESSECNWNGGLIECAACSGSIPMLELCVQNGCPYHVYVSELSVQEDKAKTLTALKWLHEKNFPLVDHICHVLASYNNVEGLKWAREIGYNWNRNTIDFAIESGDVDTLQYCLDNGCPYGPSLYENGSYENTTDEQTLNIYKCLHHHGIPWDESASHTAAYFGHLSTLKWLLDHGCPCSEEILTDSIENVDMPMLECYLANVEYIKGDVYTDLIQDMDYGRYPDVADATVIQVFQLFRDFNVDWDEGLIAYAESLDRTNVARWLKCVGCPS